MQETDNSFAPQTTPKDQREDLESGRDIPGGTGIVSDEDIDHISANEAGETETGRDHSTENRETMQPAAGVGAVQSQSDTTSDIAHIEE